LFLDMEVHHLSIGGLVMPRSAASLLVLCTLFALPAFAQVDRAALVGTVTDSSGARLPNARVEVVSPATGLRRNVQADASGSFALSSLTS